MVVLAQKDAVGGAGLAAVFLVFDVVDVAVGGPSVAAAGPGAAFVAGDDGFADGVGDGVGVPDVQDGAFGVEGLVEEAAPEGGGEGAGSGDEPDGAAGEGVLQRLPRLGGQRVRARGGGGAGALRLPVWAGRAGPGLGVGVGVGDQGDHLADEVPVGAAGDDRDDHRVAADRLRVPPRQVPVLARSRAEPGVLDGRCAVHVEEVPERDGDVDAGAGAGPVGGHLGADEELAGLLEGVVVALLCGAQVLRPPAFPEGVDDGGEGGGALGGQVAPDAPGPVEGGVEDQVPVAEPPPGRVLLRVGLLRPPRLVGGLGQQLQVVEIGPGPGGLDQDAVGLGLELVVVDAAGPPRDLPRPRDRDAPAGGRLVQDRVPAQQAHLPDGGLRVVAAEARFGGEPLSGGGVAVGVVVVGGVEAAYQPVGRRPEQGGDRPEPLQGLAPGGAVEVGGGRGVQVGGGRAGDPERVLDAG